MTIVRTRAARLWAFRAGAELEAAARFGRLAESLGVRGHARVAELAHRAALDEHRHHQLCAELALDFGAAPTMVKQPAAETCARRVAGSASPEEDLLLEVVAMSCVTESLSTALLLEMRKRAEHRGAHAVVSEVLRDEVTHARLGWAHLAWEARRLPLTSIGERLPAMLAETVRDEIFETSTGAGDDLASVGGLPRATRRAIFVSAMRQIVLPGLDSFGVDTRRGRRWLASRLSATVERAAAPPARQAPR